MKTHEINHKPRHKVMIVDDHPFLREGLTRVINQNKDLVVCGEASKAGEALAALARLLPDIVIIDISLEDGNGLDLIKDIASSYPDLPTLAFSMHPENIYAERAIKAGARGYVMKRESVDVLLKALRSILDGKIAVSDEIVSRLLSANRRPRDDGQPESISTILSDRELEVFRLFGEGHTTRQIAEILHIAVSTVESYRSSIKRKIGVNTGTELIAYAARFVASQD